jgi:RNA polymerase sigma-70 factor (ECF subfamily)
MDQDLVTRAQKGDRQAFETLAVASHPRLHKVAHGILRDSHLAEDATQQALLDVWRSLGRLRDPAKYEGWSYRLVVHACYAEAKRRPKSEPEMPVEGRDVPVSGDAFWSVLDRDQLSRGFQRLSVDHRAVLVLHYLLDMAPEHVAEVLDIKPKTVYARLSRATESLRGALEADSRLALQQGRSRGVMR